VSDLFLVVAIVALFCWAALNELQRICERRAWIHGSSASYCRRASAIEQVKLAKRARQAEEATDPDRRRFYQQRAQALASRARCQDWHAARFEEKARLWDFLS
jgi:hypothetical protein